jgi:putative PEP-CTERM system TPR-repeat lipoprotein
MVLAMQQRGEFDDAQMRLDKMIEDYPDSSALWNLKGGLYQRSGDLGAAADAFAKSIDADQKNTGAMLNLARLELVQGRAQQAERLYRNVLEIRPDDTAAMTGLAQVAIGNGDTAAAINWLQKARDTNDAVLQPRLMLGRLYLQVGDVDAAAAVASEAFSIDRNNPEAINLDGLVKLRRGRLPVAEARFKEASLAVPDEPRFVFNRARTLSAMQRADEAYQILGQMYPKHPEHAGTAVLYAALLARDNKWDEAFAIAEDLKRRYPDSPMGDSIEGDLYTAQRKDAEALAAYEAAMAKQPMLKVALRVSELRMKTDAADPEEPYLTYLETDPASIEARLMLAQVYQRTDRPAPAIEQYETVVREAPDNAIALNNLAWLYYEKDDNRAEATAAKAYELASDNPDIVDTYGWISLENGKTEEALALLREAVSKSSKPGNAEIRYHLAVALARTGEAEEAKSILEELLGSEESFASRADAASMLKNL